MERTERLWPGGPEVSWDERCFPPSTDSFLLGAFPRLRRGVKVCDLCAGTGLLGLLLAAREPSVSVVAIEKDEHACALLARTAQRSGAAMETVQADIREVAALTGRGSFDLVVCNPPYYAEGSGFVAQGARGAARSECSATLEDVLCAAEALLRFGGVLCMVYPTERLAALIHSAAMRKLEAKRMALVQARPMAAPSMVLMEFKKGGHSGLIVEPPIWIKDERGAESEYVRRAYFRDKEEVAP